MTWGDAIVKSLVLLVVSLVSSGCTFITSCSQRGAGPGTQDTTEKLRPEKPNINIVHCSIVTLHSADSGPGNVPVEDVRRGRRGKYYFIWGFDTVIIGKWTIIKVLLVIIALSSVKLMQLPSVSFSGVALSLNSRDRNLIRSHKSICVLALKCFNLLSRPSKQLFIALQIESKLAFQANSTAAMFIQI